MELFSQGLCSSRTKAVFAGSSKGLKNQSYSTVEEDSAFKGGKNVSMERKSEKGIKKSKGVRNKRDPNINSCYHIINIDGTVYDAVLHQADVGKNVNKYFVIQALEADIGEKYIVYNQWGRTGFNGQQKLLGPFDSVEQTICEFKSKFFDKTKNRWDEREKFTPFPKKYMWLEMDYTESNEDIVKANTEDLVLKKESQKSRLETCASHLSLANEVKQTMMRIGFNAKGLRPARRLRRTTILRGYNVLKRISLAVEQQNTEDLESLSSEFYSVFPHGFGVKKKMREFVIDTPEKLKTKMEMVEALGGIELATILLDCNSEKNARNIDAKNNLSYGSEANKAFNGPTDDEDKQLEKSITVKNQLLPSHDSTVALSPPIKLGELDVATAEVPEYMFEKGSFFNRIASKFSNFFSGTRGNTLECKEEKYSDNCLPAENLRLCSSSTVHHLYPVHSKYSVLDPLLLTNHSHPSFPPLPRSPVYKLVLANFLVQQGRASYLAAPTLLLPSVSPVVPRRIHGPLPPPMIVCLKLWHPISSWRNPVFMFCHPLVRRLM